MNSGHTLSLYH